MSSSNVKVVARFRPLNEREQKETGGALNCQFLGPNEVRITQPGGAPSEGGDRKFNLDRVFPPETSSKEVYEATALPIIEEVLKGYNGTVFAYGQTGSGKTFTMEGVSTDPEKMGIIPRMVATMFEAIDRADEAVEFTVKCSIVEIYMERVRDLLDSSKDNLKIHEDKTRGIYIGDVTEEYVTCEQDVFDLLNVGHKNRSVAATNMNAHSSRSHLLFIITIQQKNSHDLSSMTGKLYLVDLAGSEKVGKTGAEGTTLGEAKMINKSLSALGNVINALTDPKVKHIPYRDSKLTRILTESLGGNAKTCLMVACSPSLFNEAETVSTLRFGARAKNIKNNAKVNQERSVEELKLLLEKAEVTIESQRRYIGVLEKTLTDMGAEVPSRGPPSVSQAKATETLLEKETIDASSPSKEGPRGEGGVGGGTTEEMIGLMEDIVSKREELRAQSDEITDLRRLVARAEERSKNLSEQNTMLINKIADSAVTAEQAKYEIQELTDSTQQLSAVTKNAETELEVIRSNHKQLLDQLKEKDADIEQLSQRLSAACEDLTKLKSLLGESPVAAQVAGEVPAAAQGAGPAGEGPPEGAPRPPRERHGSASEIAAAFEAQSRDELLRQLAELREFKAFAEDQLGLLENQNATMRDLVAGEEAKEKAAAAAAESERKGMEKEVKEKASKIADLELELLEETAKVSELRAMREDGDRPLKRKVGHLDRNLEQLTIMYHKLVSQNSGLKVECQVNEKKLLRKEQRILVLERGSEATKNKYEKLLQQCKSLTEQCEQMYKSGNMARGRSGRGSRLGRDSRSGGLTFRGGYRGSSGVGLGSMEHSKLALQAARLADEDAYDLDSD